MVQAWAVQRRNDELIAFIKNKNDAGIMPTTWDIYKSVEMAKATALKYLSVLLERGVISNVSVGPTWLWYIAKGDGGNTLIPKIVFEKKE